MALLPQNQSDQVKFLVIALSLGAIFGFYTYVYADKAAELNTLEARVDTLVMRNDEARQDAARGNVKKMKAEAERYGADLRQLRQLVPTGNEVPALLEQVSTAARRVGLDIGDVQPEPRVEGDQFDTYRYQIRVAGGYHDIASFLSNVGSLSRIVAPVNLELSIPNNAVKSKDARKARIEAKFQIQTFVARAGAEGAQ